MARPHEPWQKEEEVKATGVVRVYMLASILLLEKHPHRTVDASPLPIVALAPGSPARLVKEWIEVLTIIHAHHEGACEARTLRRSILALDVENDEVAALRRAGERGEGHPDGFEVSGWPSVFASKNSVAHSREQNFLWPVSTNEFPSRT